MPISIADLIPTSPAVPTATTATTRQTSRTGSSEPFQAVLSGATAETRSAVAAEEASKVEAAKTFAQAEVTDDEADEALAAEFAGVLVAAQFGVPNPMPLNFAEAGVAAGQLTPEALNGVSPELTTNPTVPPTRANPLFRQFVAEAATQNNTPPGTTPAPTTPVVPQNALPTVPEVLPATTSLPGAVAAVQPGQLQVVVPQTPIIPGLIPPSPTTGATETPTPIVAPQAPIRATAVPESRVGDRPGTAGEQLAAIASAASTLTVARSVTQADFARVTPAEAPTPAAPVQATATTAALPSTPTNTVVSTDLTAVPNATLAASAPVANVVPTMSSTPVTNTAPTNVPTPNALTPTVPISNIESPLTTPVSTLTPRAVPNASPAPVSAPTAFVPVPPNAIATTTAPALTRPAEVVEPKSPDNDFGDAARTSGFGSGVPAPFSPNTTTAPRATYTAQPPTPAVQVADGIITHAHLVERAGTTEFQLRLDPPELGPVRIRLTQNGDGINGQVMVSDDAIRRMIESQLPELRQRLEAAGVALQSFDVSTDANTGGAGRNPYRSDAPTVDVTAATTASTPRAPPGRRGPGVLDVMA